MDKRFKIKNIVIIQNTTLAENYGLSTYLRNIVKNLAEIKELNIYLICTKGELNKITCPPNVKLYEINNNSYSVFGNAKFFLKTLLNLNKINKDNHINYIHCLYPLSSLAAAAIFKLLNNKITIIYDIRSPWIDISVDRGSVNKKIAPFFKFFAHVCEYFLSLFVDKFIFITQGLFDYYKNKILLINKPFIIIPSGIAVEQFNKIFKENIRALLHFKTTDIIIGYIGTISSMRNLELILNSFKSIITNRKDLKLLFVGDGDHLEKMKELTKNLKLDNSVLFIGKIPHNEVPRYISIFDYGICNLPNTFIFRQSFPMKILEYLAAGKWVLASKINAHVQLKKDFEQIIIYNSNYDLSNIFLTLTRKEKEIPKNIYQYDWKRIANTIKNYY